ncbi:kinesin-like protein KIN-7H isoform X2 [Panicum virgatum]|uniref:kinesin-like protein KIN-7H isoform X2 n=1 Tax=Panicum virgatum TaxID=38727 RepID=UPI0019D5D654|nr:kinesin-like protein KIN-7H isoform X2 [Panicum virgatum]
MGAAGEEMAAEAKEERILVSVRLRPLNSREAGDSSDWECISPTTIMFRSTVPERAMFPTAYTYDRVFGPSCSTRQVYEEGAKEVALSVVSGINSSIFAYGQTSSGKTYTMTGITEYSMLDIYDYIDKHPEREFILKFSAIEIYNEAVRDLLSHDSTPLRLLDDPEKGTTVERLTEETLRDYNHLRDLLTVCEAQRQIGETALNETSSRSHQILRLTIESSARQYLGRGNSSTLVACVNFVDLAGSERASQTASAGMRLKEGSHINRSLLTLGKVVRQLSKGRNGHIPYRDSKLTRILQSSLGGNARTAIICTMSPAHTHIEQSRNTLLFATCAKEVITNAHVNVVMSDKALVKHLQRELARLENEMKFPGSASCTTHTEALREKDAQIKKLEKQLKELMEERDTVQSQLNCLLKGDGDDRGNEHTAKRWDEHSRSSESLARNVSEEALSVADGVPHQDQDYASFNGSYVCSSDHNDSAFLGESRELPRQTWDQKLVSPWHPPSNHSSDSIEPYHLKEVASTTASEVSEDHCREVQCIEIHEHVRSRSQEFNQLLPEDTEIQTPDVEVISKGAVPQSDEQQRLESIKKKIEDHVKSYPINDEQQAENITKIEEDSVKMYLCESERIKENAVKLYTCDSNHSFNIGKPYPHECLNLKRCIMSSKDRALARSNSCRASFMMIPNSWFDDSDNTSRTPPDEIFRYAPRRLDKVRRSLYAENDDCQNEDPLLDCSVISCEVASDEFAKEMSTTDEVAKEMSTSDEVPKEMSTSDDVAKEMSIIDDAANEMNTSDEEQETHVNDISCVMELKENTKNCREDQSEEFQAQVIMQANRDDSTTMRAVKDVGVDIALSPVDSPSHLTVDFEKKQQQIIELWHECNVSIVHRTYFFLLFRGDPADNIYMEVEYRRLSFIKSSFSAEPVAQRELNPAIASSLKNLRRERDMLYKQMLKKLSNGEKESIYSKWGIDLSTKQRRLQLSRLIWTQTDMEHIRESASLVAWLIDLLEPGQALKEMFGMNFSLAPRTDRRSFGLVGSYSMK